MAKPTKPPQETGASSSNNVSKVGAKRGLPPSQTGVVDPAQPTPQVALTGKSPKKRAPVTRRKSSDASASETPASAKKESAPKASAARRKIIASSSDVQDDLPLPEPPPWSQSVEVAAPRQPKKAINAQPADSSTLSMRVIDKLLQVLPENQRARWRDYVVLMRMDRPVGALLLLWPTWWALWFAAKGFPSLKLFVIFTMGVFVMRSAGCVINDYADHDWLDGNVERTRGRPMAAGRVSRREAIVLFLGLLLLAFGLVCFTNPLTIALSFAGAALAAIYPFAKRVTHLAQVVLGAAFGWSIPMAFAATMGEVPALGWLLFIGNVLFSVVYDTEYAMVDRDEDMRIGAKSTAILFGDADRVILGVLMASFIVTLLLAGSRAALEWPWQLGLATAAVLFGWQQSLIRDRERDACLEAFRNNNWVGFVIWVGLVAALAMV